MRLGGLEQALPHAQPRPANEHLRRLPRPHLGGDRPPLRRGAAGLDQGVGAVVWSPLGWGRLTGKLRRGQPLPATSRLHVTADKGPQVADEHLYRVVDALDAVAQETGKTVPQIALNWLLRRPTVSTVVVGARDEEQLRQNLGAVGWELTAEQVKALDEASAVTPAYPYWHQAGFGERNPSPVG